MISPSEFTSLLPSYETDSAVFREVGKGVAAIFSEIEALADYVDDNTFLFSATDRLEDFADELKLTFKPNLENSVKREILRSRYFSMGGVVKASDIIKVCKAYTNGDIEIIRKSQGLYVFKFVSILGKPTEIEALNEVLKRMIHAGYVWSFEFKYRTWQDVRSYTWGEVSSRSWTSLREGVL